MKHYYLIQYRFSNLCTPYYLSSYGFSDDITKDIEKSCDIIRQSNGVPIAVWKIKLKPHAKSDKSKQ